MSQEPQVVHIRPSQGWRSINLREIWHRRELLFFFTWRDIKVRYKQTILGFFWAILAPLASMFIFTIIFGKVANLPSDGLPKAVFYLCGLVIWRYFANAFGATSNSIVGNKAVITKIYYPRLITPLSSCLTGLVDFAIAFAVLLLLMAYYRIAPPATALLMPLLIILAMTSALGIGLAFSSLNVKYRDIAQLVPFVTQLWMYCTVVVPFSEVSEFLPGKWRYVYGLNPMAGVVEGIRWCMLHHEMTGAAEGLPVQAPWMLIAIGLPVNIALLVFGLCYFKRTEKHFADII